MIAVIRSNLSGFETGNCRRRNSFGAAELAPGDMPGLVQCVLSTLCLVCGLLSGREAAADDPAERIRQFPQQVSRFDLATRDELLYAHWVSPFVQSDGVSQWSWVSDLINSTGKWVAAYIDAHKISDAIHRGLAIDGQPPLAKLDELVADCARILNVSKPTVIVRNDPRTTAYVVASDSQTFLVLTSALIKLYDGADDELRFVIGHELGRIKCEHLQVRKAALGLITVLTTVNQAAAPAGADAVLPTLLVGRMVTWAREAEISADRAGLLCCGHPQIAFNALARLLQVWTRTSNCSIRPIPTSTLRRSWTSFSVGRTSPS